LQRSWTEIGPIAGKIAFDAAKGERQGPLDIGYALTRQINKAGQNKTADPQKLETPAEQRIVVIGDGDFLSNAYLGNGGNLDLGINMVQWLSRGDALINIPAKIAPDRTLELSPLASGSIAVGFLFLLPGALLGAGALVWFKRRSR
jgi:ABC-type uncharacterized transport system involved in gliding motility auxiliary subunit